MLGVINVSSKEILHYKNILIVANSISNFFAMTIVSNHRIVTAEDSTIFVIHAKILHWHCLKSQLLIVVV